MAMSAEERQQMLLTQPVEKIIPKMALPTICSMLITSIYNMADTYFVSQIGTAEATASGTSASAAVGIVFSVMAMIQALAFMFGMGSGTNVSHLLGMGKRKEAEVYSAVGFFSAVAAGVLIAVLGNAFNEPLMRLLGATETAMPYALDYARYIFLAAPFMMGSLSMNNLLRFQGLATYGMVGIISGGLLNMLLDPLLIFVFDMGIAGASIATAISQLTSFVILLVMCSTHADAITIHPRNLSPNEANVRQNPEQRSAVAGAAGHHERVDVAAQQCRGGLWRPGDCGVRDCQPLPEFRQLHRRRLRAGLPAGLRLQLRREKI